MQSLKEIIFRQRFLILRKIFSFNYHSREKVKDNFRLKSKYRIFTVMFCVKQSRLSFVSFLFCFKPYLFRVFSFLFFCLLFLSVCCLLLDACSPVVLPCTQLDTQFNSTSHSTTTVQSVLQPNHTQQITNAEHLQVIRINQRNQKNLIKNHIKVHFLIGVVYDNRRGLVL